MLAVIWEGTTGDVICYPMGKKKLSLSAIFALPAKMDIRCSPSIQDMRTAKRWKCLKTNFVFGSPIAFYIRRRKKMIAPFNNVPNYVSNTWFAGVFLNKFPESPQLSALVILTSTNWPTRPFFVALNFTVLYCGFFPK